MSFDYKEYSEAMDCFLLQMEQIHSHAHPDIAKALRQICVLLKIAKVGVCLYEDARAKESGNGECAVIYRDGEADEALGVTHYEITNNGSVVSYCFYPYVGGEAWTETEQEKIALISKMLFVYNGRIRLLNLIEKLVYRDPGLDVYNLPYFMKSCRMHINAGDIGQFGVTYFNLRRFANVNQQLGREDATKIMASFIGGLSGILSEDEMVCRIGGDNFIVLFYKDRFDELCEYLKGQGMVYDEQTKGKVFVSATAGYYMIPDGIASEEDVMDNVSIAYNQARNTRESYVIFSDELAEYIRESKKLEEMFPEALENGEFMAYYQPKVALKDYTLAGAEALCRWRHNGQMIMPGKFIPVFERSKAVTQLDFYMLECVCRNIREWLDAGKMVVKISVNFSRRHLGDMDLVEHIIEIVDRYRVPHEYIEIELTETTTDVDFRDLRKIVVGLQDAGFHASVDDFGMGYSSLTLIKELPWNVLKIDKSLLEPIATGETGGSIMLGHVISMAQEMGLECLVEGVETAEQVKFLKKHNCYLAQGFFFDKPLPKEEFEKRLDEIQQENIKKEVS